MMGKKRDLANKHEVAMAEYIDRNELELDAEWSEYHDGFTAYSQGQIQCAPTADVVERSEYEKIKFERDISIQQIHDLGNSVSKAIEEISNIEQLAQYTCGDIKRMCIEILKRNIGE